MKEKIKEMIEAKLNEKITFYNEKMKVLEATENIPDIFYLITETFGNSNEQKDALVVLMKDKFKSDFFKRSKVNKKTNEIEITDGKYAVYFPTSFLRTIKVKRVDNIKGSIMRPNLAMRRFTSEFAIAYSDYKEKPSEENSERLRVVFLEDVMQQKIKLFNKGPKLEEIIEKIERFYESSINEAYEYNERLTSWKENQEKIASSELDDFKFLEDLKIDLELFMTSESWIVKTEGLNKKSIQFSFLSETTNVY